MTATHLVTSFLLAGHCTGQKSPNTVTESHPCLSLPTDTPSFLGLFLCVWGRGACWVCEMVQQVQGLATQVEFVCGSCVKSQMQRSTSVIPELLWTDGK